MRKLLYIFGILLAGCSDQGDIVREIFEGARDNQNYALTASYTLTAADYAVISAEAVKNAGDNAANKALAQAVATTNALNSFADPVKYIPVALKPRMVGLGKESAIRVHYGYTPDYLAGLNAAPPASTTLFNETFDTLEAWTQLDNSGTGAWKTAAVSGNNVAEASSFGSPAEANEIWLLSPEIDLTAATAPKLTFDIAVNYPVAGHDYLSVYAMPATIDFIPVNPGGHYDLTGAFTLPTESGALTSAGVASLDALKGSKIHLVFVYRGDDSEGVSPALTTTARVDNVTVIDGKTMGEAAPGVVFQNDGVIWRPLADALALVADDYTEMGLAGPSALTAALAPGYLPALLARKFPFAQTDARKAVLFGSNNGLREEYVYNGTRWLPTTQGALLNAQYVSDGFDWMFDPTINYTMVKADQQTMVNYMLADPARAVYVTSYKNDEYYYGFNAYHNNVSLRITGGTSNRMTLPESVNNDTELHALDGKVDEQVALLWKRLEEKGLPIFLQLKYPDSPAISQGVQLYYNITVPVFAPDGMTQITTNYLFRYRVAAAASGSTPPVFEFVSRTQI